MKQGTGSQQFRIIGERMINGNALHFIQRQALGTVMQKACLLCLQGIKSVNMGQTA